MTAHYQKVINNLTTSGVDDEEQSELLTRYW